VSALNPVLDSRFVKLLPPSVETSIRYPVIAAPPSLEGAIQDRSIIVCPDAAAVSEVGAFGAAARVTKAELEKVLVSTIASLLRIRAYRRYPYVVPTINELSI